VNSLAELPKRGSRTYGRHVMTTKAMRLRMFVENPDWTIWVAWRYIETAGYPHV
jgi:hypothetical protein